MPPGDGKPGKRRGGRRRGATSAITGRPSKYTLKLVENICRRIAEGEPLTKICKDEGMPHYITVLRWRHEHEEFRNDYARAREDAADTLVDEILAIADEAQSAGSSEAVQAARLRVDTRKWAASKMKPKAYGDRTALEHSGAVTVTHENWLATLDDDG